MQAEFAGTDHKQNEQTYLYPNMFFYPIFALLAITFKPEGFILVSNKNLCQKFGYCSQNLSHLCHHPQKT